MSTDKKTITLTITGTGNIYSSTSSGITITGKTTAGSTVTLTLSSGYVSNGVWSSYPNVYYYPEEPEETTEYSDTLTVNAQNSLGYGWIFTEVTGNVKTSTDGKVTLTYSADGKTATLKAASGATSAAGIKFGIKDAAGNSWLSGALPAKYSGYYDYIDSDGKWNQYGKYAVSSALYSSSSSGGRTLIPAETVYYALSDFYLTSITAVGSSDVTKLEVKFEDGKVAVTAKAANVNTGDVTITVAGEHYTGNLAQFKNTGITTNSSKQVSAAGSFGDDSYVPRSVVPVN